MSSIPIIKGSGDTNDNVTSKGEISVTESNFAEDSITQLNLLMKMKSLTFPPGICRQKIALQLKLQRLILQGIVMYKILTGISPILR